MLTGGGDLNPSSLAGQSPIVTKRQGPRAIKRLRDSLGNQLVSEVLVKNVRAPRLTWGWPLTRGSD